MTNEQTAIMLGGYLDELNDVWKRLKTMPVATPIDGEVEGAQEVYDGIKSTIERLSNDIDILTGAIRPFR